MRTPPRGLQVLKRTDLPADLAAIRALVEETGSRLVVVGLPLNMDGTEGPMAQKIRGFRTRLEEVLQDLDVSTTFWDERLTSETAEDVLRERGLNWRESREVVDQVAAAVILQEFLDAAASTPE